MKKSEETPVSLVDAEEAHEREEARFAALRRFIRHALMQILMYDALALVLTAPAHFLDSSNAIVWRFVCTGAFIWALNPVILLATTFGLIGKFEGKRSLGRMIALTAALWFAYGAVLTYCA